MSSVLSESSLYRLLQEPRGYCRQSLERQIPSDRHGLLLDLVPDCIRPDLLKELVTLILVIDSAYSPLDYLRDLYPCRVPISFPHRSKSPLSWVGRLIVLQ